MKRPKLKQWDGVIVEWWDIVGSGGEWVEHNEDDTEPAVCRTRGYVYAGWTRKAKRIKICGTVTEGVISHRDAIPWGCVKSIVVEERKLKNAWAWEHVDNE